MQPGKNYMAIWQKTYEMLVFQKGNYYLLEKVELEKSEQEIKNVWNTPIPPHEKVRIFTEELNKFKSLVNKALQPLRVKIRDQEFVNNWKTINEKLDGKTPTTHDIPESFIKDLPNVDHRKGKTIIDFLKMHREKVSGNENNEMVYDEKTNCGSEMSDL